jgi:hypothetical protein
MTALIHELIISALHAEQTTENDKAAQLQAQIEGAKERIADTLGELWTELAPYADEGHYNTRDGGLNNFWYVIEPPEVAAIAVLYTGRWSSTSRNSSGVYLTWSNIDYGTRVPATTDQIAAFLLEAKRAYLKRQAEERKDRIVELARKMASDYYHSLVPEETDRILAELLSLASDRAEEWQALRQAWQIAYEEHVEEQAEKAHREALAAIYREKYADYYRRYLEVKEANRARLAKLGAELAQPFDVWELEYGVVAQDEEGAPYASTRSVYVSGSEPDAEGHWMVYDAWGASERRRFYHLVSLRGPISVTPAEHSPVRREVPCYAPERQHLGTVYFNPFQLARADVEDMINTALLAYPAAPEPPGELDRYETERAQQQARRDVAEPIGAEIPF